MTWIKTCGITTLEDARTAQEAGADALGFIFAPSPRRVEPQAARKIVAEMAPNLEKVGVFVNESPGRIREIVKQVGLTAVQLHGDDVEFETALHLFLRSGPDRIRVYKALSMKELFAPGSTAAGLRDQKWQSVFDALLIDSGSPTRRGGTGLTFDWTRAQTVVQSLRKLYKVIIAGGLTPENVARAITLFRPWGVDVASGVEAEPGKKDPEKVRAFIAAVREVDKKLARPGTVGD